MTQYLPIHFRWMLAPLLFFGLLVASNRHMDFESGIVHVQADDSRHYQVIAEKAPAFPTAQVDLHHAQRFLPHYAIGTFANLTQFPLDWAYWAAIGIVCAALVFCLHLGFEDAGLPKNLQILCYAIFFANPYVMRYYLLAPPLIADLIYILGSAVIYLALRKVSPWMLLLGALVAALGKQSAAGFLPGVAVWLAFSKDWKQISAAQRSFFVVAFLLVCIATYQITAWVVRDFASSSVGVHHILSMPAWIFSGQFELGLFAVHMLRILIPFFLPGIFLAVALFLVPRWPSREELATILLIGSIAGFPMMHDPIMIRQSQGRYSGLAVILAIFLMMGFVKPLGQRLENISHKNPYLWLLASALTLASLHHLFSLLGPETAEGFAAMQIIACAIAGFSFYKLVKI